MAASLRWRAMCGPVPLASMIVGRDPGEAFSRQTRDTLPRAIASHACASRQWPTDRTPAMGASIDSQDRPGVNADPSDSVLRSNRQIEQRAPGPRLRRIVTVRPRTAIG